MVQAEMRAINESDYNMPSGYQFLSVSHSRDQHYSGIDEIDSDFVSSLGMVEHESRDLNNVASTIFRSDELTSIRDNTIICQICCKKFQELSALRIHLRSHAAKGPSVCRFCQKKFSNVYRLRRHELIHTGERPFACKVCNKRFNFGWCLRVHERIHTGDRPLVCNICDKTFSDPSNFRRHNRSHFDNNTFIKAIGKNVSVKGRLVDE